MSFTFKNKLKNLSRIRPSVNAALTTAKATTPVHMNMEKWGKIALSDK
jgi:hypothetical protein